MLDMSENAVAIGNNGIKWWKNAIIYQIYPATFRDTTGSGLGDMKGIASKIEYLASLGVDCVWLSPFFKSPQADLGYDISDYTQVDPPYGTNEDIDEIIAESKKFGIKILADLVVNHCSDEHEWFKEARASKNSSKRDWFIWRDARMIDGKRSPPNNWRSAFGGPTWTWVEETQQYYYHSFLPQQPDLDWENEECREAIYEDAVRFWLKKGIAGFRIDTVSLYSKYDLDQDVPITNPNLVEQPAWDLMGAGPRIHEFLRELRQKGLGENAVAIGELGNTPSLEQVLTYVGKKNKELDMVIQFDIAMLSNSGWKFMATPWKLSQFKELTRSGQKLTDPSNEAWSINHLENHDLSRSISRFASDAPEYRVQSAKMLATYMLTISGTPIIYQGQEIGMVNIPKDVDIDEEYKDCDTIGFMKEVRLAAEQEGSEPGLIERAKAGVQLVARDHARTPMNWNSSKNGGFSTADKCWMLPHSYKEINVADQEEDPESVLNYYRTLIKLRKEHDDVFTHGAFDYDEESKEGKSEDLFVFTKTSAKDGSKKAVVVLNFSDKTQSYSLPEGEEKRKVVLETGSAGGEGEIAPYSAKIFM